MGSYTRGCVCMLLGNLNASTLRTGFDAGRHLTVFRVLAMPHHAYVGVTQLPENIDHVNTSHLGVFGFAVGVSTVPHKHKAAVKAAPFPPTAGRSGSANVNDFGIERGSTPGNGGAMVGQAGRLVSGGSEGSERGAHRGLLGTPPLSLTPSHPRALSAPVPVTKSESERGRALEEDGHPGMSRVWLQVCERMREHVCVCACRDNVKCMRERV